MPLGHSVLSCATSLLILPMASNTLARPIVAQSAPAAYLDHAIDLIQSQALRKGNVDWPKVRAEANAMAAHADSTAGTYGAIRFVLSSLGDHHSSLHLTRPLEEAEKREDEAHPPQRTLTTESQDFSPYVGRYEPDGSLLQREGKTFGYVILPKCFPENDRQFVAFESKVQGILRELDRSHPAGWVLDLRGNVGGNMWPMLAGIGPLLGEGDNLGEFINVSERITWQYRNGVAAEVGHGEHTSNPAVEGAPYHIQGIPNVAVLIDRSTGSSGEAIAIAFRGREHTRFFGEHTQGSSTVNTVIPLSDGAELWLTIGVQADRHGKEYVHGFAPDEVLDTAKQAMQPAGDPVVQAALAWLNHDTGN
jgi:carboxyl-terminal processing protease